MADSRYPTKREYEGTKKRIGYNPKQGYLQKLGRGKWMDVADYGTLQNNGWTEEQIADLADTARDQVNPSIIDNLDAAWVSATPKKAAYDIGKAFDPSKLPTPVGESPIEDRRDWTDEQRLAAFDAAADDRADTSLNRLKAIPGHMANDLSGLYTSMFGSLVDDMPMGADIDARVKEAAEKSQQLGIHMSPLEKAKWEPTPFMSVSPKAAPEAGTSPLVGKYTRQDATKLAEAMIGEARSEGIEGMTAVGASIINRTIDGRYGGTDITSVINEPGQYTYRADGNLSIAQQELANNTPLAKQAMQTALGLLSGKIADPTNGATSYNAANAEMSGWQEAGARDPNKVTIGAHTFYDASPSPSIKQKISDAWANAEPGWFDKTIDAVKSFTGMTPDLPESLVDSTPSVVDYAQRIGIEDPSIAARARMAQAPAPAPRQLSEQDTQQADLDSFYDATNLEGVSIQQPGYSPPKAAPAASPVQDLFSNIFGQAPNAMKPGQVQLGTEVVDSGAPAIDPSFTRQQPAVTPKDPQLAGRLVPAESGIGMVEAAPPSVKQVKTVSIPVTPETVDPDAPPVSSLDRTPSVMAHVERVEAKAAADAPPVSSLDTAPSVVAAFDAFSKTKTTPSFKAALQAKASQIEASINPPSVPTPPTRPGTAPQTPAYNPLASMRPTPPEQTRNIPTPPARPAPSLEQTMQEVKTKLDALTGGYDPTKSPRAAPPAAQAPAPAPAPPASPAPPQSTIAAMRQAVGVPSLPPHGEQMDAQDVYGPGAFSVADATGAPVLGLPAGGVLGAAMAPTMLSEEDGAAAFDAEFGTTPAPEETVPQEETAVDVAETQAQPNVSKRLPQRPAITPKPVDPDPIHNLEQPDFVAGAGVFDSEGNLVGRLDDEGNPVAKTGFFSGVKDIGKGALKGGSLFGIPGAILGAAIGGANSASNIFGGPEPKAHVELAHDTDVIGANGRAGKQSVTTGLLARVNALNLGKPPAGYKYGYSPLDEGVALVHDNAPEALKIASSGPGLFGALGLTGPGGTVRAPSPSKFFGSMFGTAPAKTGSGGGITNLGGIMSGYAQTTQDFANAADKIFGGSGGSTSPGGYRTSSEGGNLHG